MCAAWWLLLITRGEVHIHTDLYIHPLLLIDLMKIFPGSRECVAVDFDPEFSNSAETTVTTHSIFFQ
jgi:hypothetical protein